MSFWDKFFNKEKQNKPQTVEEVIPQNENVEETSTIFLDESSFGNVCIIDILPNNAKEWNRGTIMWRFESNLTAIHKIKKGDEIGLLHLKYTEKRTATTAAIIEQKSYPIIVNTDGVLSMYERSLLNIRTVMNGSYYMEGDTYSDGKPIIDRGGEMCLFYLYSTMEELVSNERPYSIETDPITKQFCINGFKRNILKETKLNRWISYNCEGGQEFAFLLFHVSPCGATLKQIKTIILLFDSDTTLSFSIDKKLTSYEKNDWMDTKFRLNQEQLDLLSSSKIQMVRVAFANEGYKDLAVEEVNAEYFQAYFALFAKALVECEWKPNQTQQGGEERKEDIKDATCYVYLMHDEANGYYKIGISNKPEYREHTLQSEKPTIVLIKAKQFPIRPIAEAFEAALHKTYESKRIRGEWFNLDDADVEQLIQALS